MIFMKTRTAFVVPLLVVLLASGAIASVGWNVENSGLGTTYTYTYVNTEEPWDFITGLHVYAPVDPSLITSWTADPGWSFGTDIDPTGAADIYWYTDDPMTYGLEDGNSVTVSMTAAPGTTAIYDYVLEDFPVGNWGYDTTGGMTWVMDGSLPVPSGSASAETPEPASLLAVLAGFAGVILRRKK
jgi:hypothetical protein